jgi:hypothetical protein
MFFNEANYRELGSKCPIVNSPLRKIQSEADLTLSVQQRPATAQVLMRSYN